MPSTLRGNLAVGQSGGPTAVINATLVGVLHEAGKHAAIENIYGLRHGVEGLLKEDLMDLGGVSEELLERIKHTPAAALGSCRRKLRPDDYTRILEVFRAHNIRYFLYNGGNDSMDTCQRIADLAEREGYEIRVIGVPKTIDNDLMYTDHSPGYGSAARYCAMSVRDMGRDVEAMAGYDRVALYESMGRHAGWLTAASCLGKADEIDPPHLVYLPEVPFSEERFLDDVSRCFVKVWVCHGGGGGDVEDGRGRDRGTLRGYRELRFLRPHHCRGECQLPGAARAGTVGDKGAGKSTRHLATVIDGRCLHRGSRRGLYGRPGGSAGGHWRGRRRHDHPGAHE